jgi:hypothetical protein
MTLFETTAVKKVIEFTWPLVLKHIVRKLFIPFQVFLVTYLIYMSWVFKSSPPQWLEIPVVVLL